MSLHRVSCCCEPVFAIKGVWCGTSPAACDWTTAPALYFATTTLCAGTVDPIESGQVVFYRGLCYVLTDDFEPPPVMMVEDVDEVECIGTGPTCGDTRCGGPWYYQAQICERHGPNLCVLIEYCDAQEIFAAAQVPGVQAVQCITFQVNDRCYQLLPSGFVGYVPDITDCQIVTAISQPYRNCCHCSQAHHDQECASSERVLPTHYSLGPTDCWTGDRQGVCCGARYSMTWFYQHRYEVYGGLGLEIDDTVTHSGTWVIGPPVVNAACPGDKVMQVGCVGSFDRVFIDTFNTYTFNHDIYANWLDPQDLLVLVPFGCWDCVYVDHPSGCPCMGGNLITPAPTPWVQHFWLSYGWNYLTVNGRSLSTDCTYAGVEVSGPISVSASWNYKNSTGSGSFAYFHEIRSSGQLTQRVTVTASYSRQTIIPCELCSTVTTANVVPPEGGGDSLLVGCGPGCGGGATETWEVL